MFSGNHFIHLTRPFRPSDICMIYCLCYVYTPLATASVLCCLVVWIYCEFCCRMLKRQFKEQRVTYLLLLTYLFTSLWRNLTNRLELSSVAKVPCTRDHWPLSHLRPGGISFYVCLCRNWQTQLPWKRHINTAQDRCHITTPAAVVNSRLVNGHHGSVHAGCSLSRFLAFLLPVHHGTQHC